MRMISGDEGRDEKDYYIGGRVVEVWEKSVENETVLHRGQFLLCIEEKQRKSCVCFWRTRGKWKTKDEKKKI